MNKQLCKTLDDLIELEFDKLQIYRNIISYEYTKEFSKRDQIYQILLEYEEREEQLINILRRLISIDTNSIYLLYGELEIIMDSDYSEDSLSRLIFQDELEIVYKKVSDIVSLLDFERSKIEVKEIDENIWDEQSDAADKLGYYFNIELIKVLLIYLEESINDDKNYDLRYYLIKAKYELIYIKNIIEKEYIDKFKLVNSSKDLIYENIDLVDEVFLTSDTFSVLLKINPDIFQEIKQTYYDCETIEQIDQLSGFYADDDIKKQQLAEIVLRCDYISAAINFVDEILKEELEEIIVSLIQGIDLCDEDDEIYNKEELQDALAFLIEATDNADNDEEDEDEDENNIELNQDNESTIEPVFSDEVLEIIEDIIPKHERLKNKIHPLKLVRKDQKNKN